MSPPRRPRGHPPRRRSCSPAGRAGVLACVLGLVGLLTALAPGTALALPSAPAAPAEPAGPPVVVSVDGLSPRVVTADDPPELVLSGHVTNQAAVPVRDLAVRLARGATLEGGRDTFAALDGTAGSGDVRPDPVALAPELAPGAQIPFTVRLPLFGSPASSLALESTGVYPLVVEATGALGSAGQNRLDAQRVLLPVVGLPGVGPAPPPASAAGVAVLYPIADRPRRLPVVPGTPTLLTDDDLAGSFAPGGRLAGLVDALGRSAPTGSVPAKSVCLAVDADLLETAAAMAGGYQVRTPDGGARPGTGAADAGRWLDALRAQARGRCVLALPYAETDLVATGRADLTDLGAAATSLGSRQVGDLLGVPPLADTTWPAEGVVDERALADLTGGGARALVLDGDALDGGSPPGAVARLAGAAGSAPTVLATDSVATDAFSPHPDPAAVEAEGSRSPAGTGAPLAAQDALGVLAARALGDTPTGRTTVFAPPTDWAAGSAEAGAFLDGVGNLARLGLVRPIDAGSLLAVPAAGPAPPTASLASPGPAIDELDPALVARAGAVRDRQRELLAATQRDGVGAPSPADFVEPLTESVLRSVSADRRGDPAGQEAAVAAVEAQSDQLRSLVRIVQPSGSYSLGSNDAPLLLTVENRLPVAIRVQVVLEPTNGLRTTPLPVITVPAFGSRQVQVEVEVVRAGQFSVAARAQTPGGETLGPTARLLLRSTAYGTITVWLTACAAVILVVLASVRIIRRVRTARRGRRSHRSPPGTTTGTSATTGTTAGPPAGTTDTATRPTPTAAELQNR